MRKELEKHHSECVCFLQNQIKIKDEMIKKQAQERISDSKLFKNMSFWKSELKKIERLRINQRIYGRGRRSLSPQVPPGGWDRGSTSPDDDCKFCQF